MAFARILPLALVSAFALGHLAVAQSSGIFGTQVQTNVISFDYPGATNTQATAVASSGDIVGRYLSTDGRQHGFLRSDTGYTSIDYPNAVFTDVNWINALGDVVGEYRLADGASHGFLLSHGKFTSVDYPGALGTAAFGIGINGAIVGIWYDQNWIAHGFLHVNGNFTSLNYPAIPNTLPTMISAAGITGGYAGPSGTFGFLLNHGQWQTLDCPGATFVFLSGIDPAGNIVGGFGTADGFYHGALLKGGNCIRVDFPGGINTWANGSNPQGDLVGRYDDAAGVTHAYLMRRYIKTASHVYSAAANFSAAKNPNTVWSYGYGYGPTGPFTLDALSGATYSSGEVGWFGPMQDCCAPGYPLIVAQANVVPDVLDIGPGWNSYAMVRWTAPSAGTWDVVARYFGTGATTTDVHVLRNGVALYDGFVNGSDVVNYSAPLKLNAGDRIDFTVGPNGTPWADSTGFNATITPE